MVLLINRDCLMEKRGGRVGVGGFGGAGQIIPKKNKITTYSCRLCDR
jgi:hypothetical protein